MVLITAAILIRQARFDSSTLLRSLAYSVALTVREAQVYGISVLGVSGGTVFAPAYGVYFNNANSYILFADANGDGQYNTGDTAVETYQVGAGFQIKKVCANLSVGGQACWAADGSGTISWLTIVFRRPNPDACTATSANVTVCSAAPPVNPYSGAYIQVSAINDPTNTHSISVSLTGQISVGTAGT